ncbi:hypothetical protein PC118_g6820 [Phytophthora cactorum]|uniref:Uncharacterized protein n=1 Tax=Phytophthora cactorum TaxID=29920 RepID=A0A8T0ZE51_9STRA|nr:hypothetical protein PC113_g7819 [Phytophthora cactorum]KAG2988300.1 hypothetical protein PC118_g6820 [Phytophthora cactorum]
MSEIPGVRKHVNSQASGETKRRRIARGASSNSQPTDNALSSSLGGIVDLKRAWSKLRKEGWTSRLPRLGLDNRYIRPGENPKGVEGVDFLVGEEAVLQFISSRADKTQPSMLMLVDVDPVVEDVVLLAVSKDVTKTVAS